MIPFEEHATLTVRSGLETDTQHGAVIPPLYLSSNYTFAGLGQAREFEYTRSGAGAPRVNAAAGAGRQGCPQHVARGVHRGGTGEHHGGPVVGLFHQRQAVS